MKFVTFWNNEYIAAFQKLTEIWNKVNWSAQLQHNCINGPRQILYRSTSTINFVVLQFYSILYCSCADCLKRACLDNYVHLWNFIQWSLLAAFSLNVPRQSHCLTKYSLYSKFCRYIGVSNRKSRHMTSDWRHWGNRSSTCKHHHSDQCCRATQPANSVEIWNNKTLDCLTIYWTN